MRSSGIFIVLIGILGNIELGLAQGLVDGSSLDLSQASEIGITMGTLLPSENPNMTEIISAAGIRYKFASPSIETTFLNGTGDGVSYSSLEVAYREDFPYGDIIAFSSLGAHLSFYQNPSLGLNRNHQGLNFSGGAMAYIGSNAWFRSEMKFSFNPGTQLYIGFGFFLTF